MSRSVFTERERQRFIEGTFAERHEGDVKEWFAEQMVRTSVSLPKRGINSKCQMRRV